MDGTSLCLTSLLGYLRENRAHFEEKTMNLFQPTAKSKSAPVTYSDPELQAIATRTAKLIQNAKRPQKWGVAWVLGLFIILQLYSFADTSKLTNWGGFWGILLALFLLCLPAISIAVVHGIWKRRKQGEELVLDIERRGKPDATPFIVDVILNDAVNYKSKPSTLQVLQLLLSRVTANEATCFLPRHIQWMNRTLMNTISAPAPESANVEVSKGIILACRYVGNTELLLAVNAIVRRATPAHRSNGLYDTAEQCLPEIQACVAHQTAQTTLLRASSEPNVSPELLRPVMGATQEPEQELLRPKE